MTSDEIIENHPFDEIRIGDSASITRTLSRDDVALFAAVSGDVNPTHLEPLGPSTAQSKWAAALAWAVLGDKLRSPSTFDLERSVCLCPSAQLA